jgi:hypothetical protein
MRPRGQSYSDVTLRLAVVGDGVARSGSSRSLLRRAAAAAAADKAAGARRSVMERPTIPVMIAVLGGLLMTSPG